MVDIDLVNILKRHICRLNNTSHGLCHVPNLSLLSSLYGGNGFYIQCIQ